MINKEMGLNIYNKMIEIRNFEETAWKLFQENKVRGSVHLYTGQEAVAATVCSQLTDEDYITSTHRGHGHCIAKGAELDRALAELMGKATGYCKGRGGSMHIADFAKGNLGANAIVGGGIPIATGSALSIKMQGKPNVSVSFFGDGASNQGTFHESINMAAIWKLPVIYICENNQFGLTMPVQESTAVENISDRAVGYAIPGETVDGNDVLAIYEAFARAKEHALNGKGPSLIECKTYRWRGHWAGDPEVYRTREEVEEWKENKDPIKIFHTYLLKQKLATRKELDEIDVAIAEKMAKAVEFAMNSPEPDPAHVLDDVFYETSGGVI
jgi:pyruvate dehydrogenase E1 component alpha subunit